MPQPTATTPTPTPRASKGAPGARHRRGPAMTLAFAFVICVVLILLQNSHIGWIGRSQLITQDYLIGKSTPAPADARFVFLAIDDTSIGLNKDDLEDFDVEQMPAGSESREALELMSKGWIWNRKIYGHIINRLARAGARVIALDLTFPSEKPDEDPFFKSALDAHYERVVIGTKFFSDTTSRHPEHRLDLPAESLITQFKPLDPRVGHVNFWPFPLDDIVRDTTYRATVDELNGHAPIEGVSIVAPSFAHQIATAVGTAPISGPAQRYFHWAGPPGTFKPRSVYEIFVERFWQSNFGGGEFFRDKIVVLGAAGVWAHDESLTPFGIMPGPEIQINAANAMIHGAFYRIAPAWSSYLGIVLAAGLAWALSFIRHRMLLRLALLPAIIGAWLFTCGQIYTVASLMLPITLPIFAFGLTSIASFVAEIVAERIETARIRSTLDRYVSPDVAEQILSQRENYLHTLGGVLSPATVLFSDIRGFTKASASTPPEEIVAFLNEYFTEMVACVFKHGGTLDKFIGDALMATWGTTTSHGPREDARRAMRCALDMSRALQRLNTRWLAQGRPEAAMGVALHHGDVVAGNIGAPERKEFTVIGDVVNTTWRFQERTKQHGVEIIIGDSLLEYVSDLATTAPLGEYTAPDSPRSIPYHSAIAKT